MKVDEEHKPLELFLTFGDNITSQTLKLHLTFRETRARSNSRSRGERLMQEETQGVEE